MIAAKHTKGPWWIEDSEGRDNFSIIPVASGGSGWVGDRYMRVGGAIDIHDARLIAAAPDLLEACQAIIYAWETGASEGLAEHWIRSAIAKATGSTTTEGEE